MTESSDIASGCCAGSGDWLSGRPVKRWHLVVAAAVVVVYLAGTTGRWWPTSDSALYLSLGRCLAAGEGYRYNGDPHNVATPGLPLVLAGLQKLFGEEAYWAPNVLMTLCGLAALWLVYRVTVRLSAPWPALGVALATALSYGFYHTSHRILTDAPFAALFWGALYAALRFRKGSSWWLVLAGVLAAAGVAVRAPGLLVLGPLAVALAVDGSGRVTLGRRAVASGVILAMTVLAAFGFLLLAWANVEGTPAYAGYAETLRSGTAEKGVSYLVGRVLAGAAALPEVTGEILTGQARTWPLGLVGLALAAVGAVHLGMRGRLLVPTIVVLFLGGLFLTRGGVFNDRYLMAVQPLLLLLSLDGLCWCVDQAARRSAGRAARAGGLLAAVVMFAVVIIVPNAVPVVRNAFYYSALSHTPSRYYETIRRGRFREFWLVAAQLRRGPMLDRPAAMTANDMGILHWLGRRTTVGWPETALATADDAGTVHAFFAARPDVAYAVLNLSEGTAAYRESLVERFAATDGLLLVYDGEDFRVYRRAAPGGDSETGTGGP